MSSDLHYLVEATRIELVSENPSCKPSTSVAYPLHSLGRRGQARSKPWYPVIHSPVTGVADERSLLSDAQTDAAVLIGRTGCY